MRQLSRARGEISLCFNPRIREGVRRFLQDLSQYKKGNFNPRTHIGCDYLHSQASKLAYHFNPRTIVGQDVVCPHFLVPLFNPRIRGGCDRLHFSLCTFLSCILIHASARDATSQISGCLIATSF